MWDEGAGLRILVSELSAEKKSLNKRAKRARPEFLNEEAAVVVDGSESEDNKRQDEFQSG